MESTSRNNQSLLSIMIRNMCVCAHKCLWNIKILFLPNRHNFASSSECLDDGNISEYCLSSSHRKQGSESGGCLEGTKSFLQNGDTTEALGALSGGGGERGEAGSGRS